MTGTEAIAWLDANALNILATIILVMLVGSVMGAVVWDRRASISKYLEHRREIRIQRGILMGRKKKADREAYLKGLWGDAITDYGEASFLSGKMTREEVNSFYRAIGKTHKMPDLVAVMTPPQLKSAIKSRRARGIGPATGPSQEEPWLDGKPEPPKDDQQTSTPTQANVINATKRFGEKALSRVTRPQRVAL